MKYNLKVLLLMVIPLVWGDTNAMTISATIPAVYKAYMQPWSTSSSLHLQLKLICKAPSGFIAKWSQNGATNTGNFTQPCNPDGTLWDTGFSVNGKQFLDFSWAIDVTSSSDDGGGIPDGVYLEWQFINDFGSKTYGSSVKSEEITPAKTCSVNVNQLVNIPDLSPGAQVNAIRVTSDGKGEGHLTFKPASHDENGGFLNSEEGTDTLSYSVTDSSSGVNWNTADAQWRGNLTSDYSIKLDNIPESIQPGEYRGTMEVVIQCE
jgi:hypothetical protein